MTWKRMCPLQLLLGIGICFGSKIELTTTPNNIVEGVTETFTVSCSLRDTVSSETVKTGTDYVATRENLVILNSIIIRKLEGDIIKEISRVVTGHPATVSSEFKSGTATGNLTEGYSDNLKYLTVTWNSPGQNLAGPYICEINAADLNGDNLKFTSNSVTTYRYATVHDLIALVARVKQEMNSTAATVKDLIASVAQARQEMHNTAAAVKDLIASVAQARQEMNSTTATIKDLIASVAQIRQEKISRSEMHFEYGEAVCQDSNSWGPHGPDHNKYIDVKFAKPYTNVPLISLALSNLDMREQSSNIRYAASMDSRTTTGFRIHCGTWANSYITRMDFQWTSYGI